MRHKWNGRLIGSVLSSVAVGWLGAVTVWADHFQPLSPNHTNYGVAQLNYGNISQSAFDNSEMPAFKLMNPNHIPQAVAGLIYSSDRGQQRQPSEVFLGCKVDVLTPHGSTDISGAELVAAGVPDNRPLYGEFIWAPIEKVTLRRDDDDDDKKGDWKRRRIADGLGGSAVIARGEVEGEVRLAHPGLFSLPSDSVVAGQRQKAINCICAELAVQDLDPKVFSEFGVTCP